MALEIKQSLRLGQQLVITPQLQQAIKLLQLSRLELQNLVQHELLENPVLEELSEAEEAKEEMVAEPSDPAHEAQNKEQKAAEVGTKTGELKEPTNFDWENYLNSFNSSEMEAKGGPSDLPEEGPSYENMVGGATTLQDHLLWQLHMSDLKQEEVGIAESLIGSINDDGYLQVNLQEIATEENTSLFEVENVLKRVQEFDPSGVASRDLKECLKAQIKPFSGRDRDLLESLIDQHLEDLEKKNYPHIIKSLKISQEKLRDLAHIISTLEPKPGRPFGGERIPYIIPDVYIEKVGNEYIIALNDDGLPKLQVSNFYRNALSKQEMPSQAKEYIQDKLRSAMWLIRSIHQRQRTLYKVTTSIIKFQKNFLDNGITQLKPLILKDVADDISMHESTISRVTTNKYVQTPRGLFELKFFFNPRVSTANGSDGMTSEAVKQEIRKMVTSEDARKPLSDQVISEFLQKNNIHIARRTVAKYREVLGILPASRRKQSL